MVASSGEQIIPCLPVCPKMRLSAYLKVYQSPAHMPPRPSEQKVNTGQTPLPTVCHEPCLQVEKALSYALHPHLGLTNGQPK